MLSARRIPAQGLWFGFKAVFGFVRSFRLPRRRVRLPVTASVSNPEFFGSPPPREVGPSGADLRARAQNRLLPESKRIEAISVLRTRPTHDTVELWEGLFSDPSAEVRSFAKAIVSDARQALLGKIDRTEAKLRQAGDANGVFRLYTHLAELQWELVYQKLERRNGLNHALDRVDHYAQAALALNRHDPQMWYLLGRCALLRGDPDTAESYLNQARACHFPIERLLPWLAEAAFLRRDYVKVQMILGAANRVAPVPALQPVVRYWTLHNPSCPAQ